MRGWRTGLTAAAIVLFTQTGLADFQATIDLSMGSTSVAVPAGDSEARIVPARPRPGSPFPTGIEIRIPGYQPVTAAIDDGPWINYGQWAGAIRLAESDAAESLLFEAYSGGAHCCSVLTVITPVGGHLRIITLPFAEGELRAALPVDIDGDGIIDIVREAEHTEQAGHEVGRRSAIYNIRDGRLSDVTSDPKFAAYLAGRGISGNGGR